MGISGNPSAVDICAFNSKEELNFTEKLRKKIGKKLRKKWDGTRPESGTGRVPILGRDGTQNR